MENSQISPELTLALTNHSICRRASHMYTLLTGYSLFKSIQSKKRIAKMKITYQKAEKMADLLERTTGIKVSPSDLLIDENRQADSLLDDYAELNEIMSIQDKNMRSAINAYYNYLYYSLHLSNSRNSLLLTGLSAFLNYAQGKIDKRKLKKGFRDFDIKNMRIITVDSMYIRQKLIKLENDFNEICLKSAERSRKKNGEGPGEG